MRQEQPFPFTFTFRSSYSPESSFSPPVPSVEVVDNDTASSTRGVRTPSESDADDGDPGSNLERILQALELENSPRLLPGTPATPRSNNPAESMALSPAASPFPSTYRAMFDATPEPAARHSSRAFGDGSSQDNDAMSDVDSDGSDSDESSLYDVRHERLPRAKIYNADLQAALGEVKQHLTGFRQEMRQCPLANDPSSNLASLYEKVRALDELECPETRTVGFIGDSGVGKSRLINSLLDIDLARSSGDGAACTSVVTEFRNVDALHPNRYTIEVDYMNTDEVKELLEELLQSFRMYHTDSFREVTTPEEQQRVRDLSTRAWSSLSSMFRDQPELTVEFLANENNGALPNILDRLHQWSASSFRRRPGGTALSYSISPMSLEECRTHLDMLTMDPHEEGEVAIWPFIKLIKVYLRSPILRTGLVLADLPGFRDLNFARVRATERYLKHSCDEVFLVTTISRCITDQSIQETKRRCHKDQPFRIVCTRSEEVEPNEMIRTHRDLAAQIETLQNRVKSLNKRLGRLRRGTVGGNELLQLSENVANAELELDRFLIESRNRKVTDKLTRDHKGVRVFCVSNKLYSKHRESGLRDADTYIELSGIRQLRRYCQLVPAEAQFRFTATFLQHRVPALVGSIRQWALAGSDQVDAERARALQQSLQEIESMFRERFLLPGSEFRTFRQRFEEQFNDNISHTTQERRIRWKNSAVEASQDWAGLHHTTYAAFCRRYGTHSTQAAGYRCWNDELLEAMRNDIEQEWESTKAWVRVQAHSLRGIVRRTFREAVERLNDQLALAPIALGNLIDNMGAWEATIMVNIQRSLESLLEGLSGSDVRRKRHMHVHVTTSDIFTQVITDLEADRLPFVHEMHETRKQMMNEEVGNITSDFRAFHADEGNVPEGAQFPEIRDALFNKAERAQSTLDRVHLIINGLEDGER
ncbi:hypothetical protein MW887_007683 [Aspergillus wentii]|nr:hypothetical protein MW887_007683 [Aspergillus wentii]